MRNEADIGASHVPDFLLAEATLVFDEYVQNTFYKVSLLQSHLKLISLVSTIVSIIILLFVGIVPALKLFGWVPAKDLVPFDFNVSPAFLALAACFGVLGAAVSAILSSKLDISATIPEGISTPVLALGRAAVGAPAAILIVLLLQTPLLTIADSSKSDLPLLLVASFAAGFSERLVLRAVESVSGGSSGGAT
jgi:hypothetical protein